MKNNYYVVTTYMNDIVFYYCGYFMNNKPVISIDFNKAALFIDNDTPYSILETLTDEFYVEEHGF
jgi:hypothetical protein